jgi:hypothetical protein
MWSVRLILLLFLFFALFDLCFAAAETVSGEGLDELGPIVVGKSGQMGRLESWSQMTRQERKNIVKVLKKQNKLRMDKLKKEKEL